MSNARQTASRNREEICDLVRRERIARDQKYFDEMRDCFHDDARIRTSWFDGGAEDYVAATRRSANSERARREKSNSKHWVFPGLVRLNGQRATVESPALIFNRVLIEGVQVDTRAFCRFFSRVVEVEDGWKLMSFEVLFERDGMRCVNPEEGLPVDWGRLAGYRRSYQFLTYLQETRGIRVNPDLYGDDRPEDLEAFYAAESAWLQGADMGGR